MGSIAFPWQKRMTKPRTYARAIIRADQYTVMKSDTSANLYCARRSPPAAGTGATLKPASRHASMPPVSGNASLIPARRKRPAIHAADTSPGHEQ
jgi:hypothetical protein